MINFNYENIKKSYKRYLFEQEIKAFLKRQYGIEHKKPIVKRKIIKEITPEFIKEVQDNAKWIKSYLEQIENPKSNNSTNIDISDKIKQIKEFISNYEKRVGKEQCVKDLQRGLNIINGYKKDNPIVEERMIKEDGDFGKITNCCLKYICNKHSLEYIKRFVLTGAFNNAYAKSCFDKRINIDKEIDKIICDLAEEK
ncbi:MAG: hypothetical protein OIF36_04700 [Alphaproteobacteria bacterium]|nr:hypothetical protein [Alphaproteobacteria bacterium]